MLEIGINLAMTIKTFMGRVTAIYVIRTVVDLIKTPNSIPTLNTIGIPTRKTKQEPTLTKEKES
jgi:hypothetical protein